MVHSHSSSQRLCLIVSQNLAPDEADFGIAELANSATHLSTELEGDVVIDTKTV